ncbi:unnamed protein product [Cuscuta campestris]|uniref:Uncharacterized protein n=1 Tax=Cuscuta campestris TaxID=132261 RepID=A0A484L1G6_9ASTE|nr:unnamed protein product [Cuscuta campestris]
MGGGGGGKSGSITIGRYEYVHDVGKWPIEAIDAYHVMLSGSTLLKASILFSFLIFLLPSAVYICSILVHVRSISALFYSLLIGAFLIGMYLKLVVRESVIILPAFGVQIETRYRSWSGNG